MLIQRAALAAASFRSIAGRTTTSAASFKIHQRPASLASLRPRSNILNGCRPTVCWVSTTVDVPPPPTSHHAHTKLPNARGTIIYTETDEAPALATYSLYPAVNKIAALAGIDVVPCDVRYFSADAASVVNQKQKCVPFPSQNWCRYSLSISMKQISVAGRVLALFPEKLKPDQRVPDNLAYLGELAKTPEANIIKLPNSKSKINCLCR
jgi:hypothetical protein